MLLTDSGDRAERVVPFWDTFLLGKIEQKFAAADESPHRHDLCILPILVLVAQASRRLRHYFQKSKTACKMRATQANPGTVKRAIPVAKAAVSINLSHAPLIETV
jgi:hypothetical protein